MRTLLTHTLLTLTIVACTGVYLLLPESEEAWRGALVFLLVVAGVVNLGVTGHSHRR